MIITLLFLQQRYDIQKLHKKMQITHLKPQHSQCLIYMEKALPRALFVRIKKWIIMITSCDVSLATTSSNQLVRYSIRQCSVISNSLHVRYNPHCMKCQNKITLPKSGNYSQLQVVALLTQPILPWKRAVHAHSFVFLIISATYSLA